MFRGSNITWLQSLQLMELLSVSAIFTSAIQYTIYCKNHLAMIIYNLYFVRSYYSFQCNTKLPLDLVMHKSTFLVFCFFNKTVQRAKTLCKVPYQALNNHIYQINNLKSIWLLSVRVFFFPKNIPLCIVSSNKAVGVHLYKTQWYHPQLLVLFLDRGGKG